MRAQPVRSPVAEPADTRAVILAVARRLFARGGFDGVPMREIGRACGLTMPTLYHHFGHKRGLYAACREAVIAEAGQALSSALDAAATPDAALEAFAMTLCRQLLQEYGLLALLQQDAARGGHSLDMLFTPGLLARIDQCFAARAHADSPPRDGARRLCAFAYGQCALARLKETPAQAGQRDLAPLARMLLASASADPS